MKILLKIQRLSYSIDKSMLKIVTDTSILPIVSFTFALFQNTLHSTLVESIEGKF